MQGEPPVDSKTIKVRRSQSKLKKLDPPAPPVLQLIRQAGFGGVIDLPFISLDIGLMTALLERWRPETHSFQPQHYDNETTFGDFPGQCSQYRYNYDTTSFQGQSSAEFPCHDTTFRGSASQLHDELIQEEHEGSDEEGDEGSESSLEDVDAALEADGLEDDYIDGQGNTILAHKPPCPMYTQDT
ncbi:hypothetical protein RHGRI_014982 [Rhododendron griersonianum]|uniref:Uncharacterized protein n=1 Tax=Rhododendron griersonianum TaxID=479676 RepID=A0AAV6KBI8_9ERIC|nr:hypothetical protein RHGRI_014982 [Rhododendron griersonianum]